MHRHQGGPFAQMRMISDPLHPGHMTLHQEAAMLLGHIPCSRSQFISVLSTLREY